MSTELEAHLTITPPAGWVRVELPGAQVFTPADDLAVVGGEIREVRLSLYVHIIATGAGRAHDDAIEELMGRRVGQGYPDRFDAQIEGLGARGFDWTDGITDILSYFVSTPAGHLVEFLVARAVFPVIDEQRAPLGDVAAELLRGVRWTSSSR